MSVKRSTASTSALMIVLLVLIGAGIAIYLHYQKYDSPSFSDKSLVQADTTDITGWQINTPGDSSRTYTINRKDNGWLLTTAAGAKYSPRADYIRRSLKHLQYFRPSALASVSKNDWHAFGVDDSGTVLHIISRTPGTKASDVIIGKLTFVNANKASYYVRQKGATDTYTVDLYLDGSLKATVNDMTGRK
jgi:hypothetical protein